MKSVFRQIIALLPALLFSIIVPAQNIPVLPDDPAIIKGILPNGMSYFIAKNPSSKGHADFALVQKTGRNTASGFCDDADVRAVAVARDALASLPRLGMSPQDFMVRHGAAPDTGGFVTVDDEATVYRFSGVKIGKGREVLDSALLVIMDITDRVSYTSDRFLKKWYTPEDQAVIVSGDLDASVVVEKLRMLSLMTPACAAAERNSAGTEAFPSVPAGGSSIARLDVSWRSQRVPRAYMNTVQPLIFERSMHMLGSIAVRRISHLLEVCNIPAADVSYTYVPSSATPYDDVFSVHVAVPEEYEMKAFDAVSQIMSALELDGVCTEEYLLAEAGYDMRLAEEVSLPVVDDREYVDRCISAFLYNSSLASASAKKAFHQAKNIPDTTRCRLFNGIVLALLENSESLVAAGENDVPELRHSFDTIPFPGMGPKVKLRSAKKDHLSGGHAWTFSNGIRVIYKEMKTGGSMYYMLALNRGYGNVRDLSAGEGAYFSDYPDMCRFSGLSGREFKEMLMYNGMTMDTRVTLSNTLVSGVFPREKTDLFMRSLLAYSNERERDEDAADYYLSCQSAAADNAEGSYYSRITAIENAMCPDYRYSSYKTKEGLSGQFPAKAERFFAGLTAGMNDGVLVLVGDMDPEALKKVLLSYVGGFRTDEVLTKRPAVRYQPVSGWSTYTVEGSSNCVDVALSSRLPLTAENYMAAAIASMVVKDKMEKALKDSGLCVGLSYNCRIYPEERVNMLISVSEALPEGFAAGMSQDDPISALSRVRTALSSLSDVAISDTELNDYKAFLKHRVGLEMKDPAYWTNAIVVRYLDGKDLTTGYASKIDALTADKIERILRMLDAGSKVEYVTIKKN